MKKSSILAYMEMRTNYENKLAATRQQIAKIQDQMFYEKDDAEFLLLEEIEATLNVDRAGYLEVLEKVNGFLKTARKENGKDFFAAAEEHRLSLPEQEPIQMIGADVDFVNAQNAKVQETYTSK